MAWFKTYNVGIWANGCGSAAVEYDEDFDAHLWDFAQVIQWRLERDARQHLDY